MVILAVRVLDAFDKHRRDVIQFLTGQGYSVHHLDRENICAT